jgi:hypothetical protein
LPSNGWMLWLHNSYIVISSTELFHLTITLHVSTTKGHPQVSQFTHTSTKSCFQRIFQNIVIWLLIARRA